MYLALGPACQLIIGCHTEGEPDFYQRISRCRQWNNARSVSPSMIDSTQPFSGFEV
jgi:hypothetical protein